MLGSKTTDYIIIGSDISGIVLANRLSTNNDVLMLDIGDLKCFTDTAVDNLYDRGSVDLFKDWEALLGSPDWSVHRVQKMYTQLETSLKLSIQHSLPNSTSDSIRYSIKDTFQVPFCDVYSPADTAGNIGIFTDWITAKLELDSKVRYLKVDRVKHLKVKTLKSDPTRKRVTQVVVVVGDTPFKIKVQKRVILTSHLWFRDHLGVQKPAKHHWILPAQFSAITDTKDSTIRAYLPDPLGHPQRRGIQLIISMTSGGVQINGIHLRWHDANDLDTGKSYYRNIIGPLARNLRNHHIELVSPSEELIYGNDDALEDFIKTTMIPMSDSSSYLPGGPVDCGNIADEHGCIYGTENVHIIGPGFFPMIADAPPLGPSCLTSMILEDWITKSIQET